MMQANNQVHFAHTIPLLAIKRIKQKRFSVDALFALQVVSAEIPSYL
jgi:hypothetical protein